MFKFLEEVTLNDVYYLDGFSGGIDGEYKLTARTDTYENMKNQLVVLSQDPRVLSLDSPAVELYEEEIRPELEEGEEQVPLEDGEERVKEYERGVEFEIGLTLNNELFFNQSTSTEDKL